MKIMQYKQTRLKLKKVNQDLPRFVTFGSLKSQKREV